VVAARALIALGILLPVFACPWPAASEECVVIDDFSNGKVGELPPGWKLRKDSGRGVYSLQTQEKLHFLHAVSRGIGIQAAKQHEWDLSAYPILAWSWRPVEFPKGSDERHQKTNDSALAVYSVFPHTHWSVKSLKYIWSAVVPVGTQLTSSKGLTKVRVLRSGAQGAGEWIEERANVLDDYRASFGAKEIPKPAGIAVLTDSDDTESSAQGDYANFRACKP
jgi:DUF3047 family protein